MEICIQKSQFAKLDSSESIAQIKGPLEQLMKKFNDQKQLDKLLQAKQSVESAAKEMNENITKMVEREASLQSIDSKAETLSSSALEFQNSATRLKRNMWLRGLKMKILILLICLGVIFVLVFPFIGGSGKKETEDSGETIKQEGDQNTDNNHNHLFLGI